MKNQTYEEAVLKVVMWWSDKAFRTPLNQDNGDEANTTNLLLNMVASKSQTQVTDEKIKKFEDKLIELLMENRNRNSLSVDYTPCRMLFEAAQFAEIDSHCFPVKSGTYIEKNNKAFAKYQYGGPYQQI